MGVERAYKLYTVPYLKLMTASVLAANARCRMRINWNKQLDIRMIPVLL